MWTRKELKDRAKEALKKNYWKAVLVSLILTLLTGGLSLGQSFGGNSIPDRQAEEITQDVTEGLSEDLEYSVDTDMAAKVANEMKEATRDFSGSTAAMIGVMVIIFIVIFLFALAIGVLISVFLLNPLMIGAYRFFNKDLESPAKIGEIGYSFDHSYLNIVKIMFLKDLFISLWSLLFIIPGIIKCYEYRMIPYILGDNPDMTREEAFARSKEMMDGNKWNAFVLDLSFIGWGILSIITCGLLAIFYVSPYKNLTNAALYRKLSGRDDVTPEVFDSVTIEETAGADF